MRSVQGGGGGRQRCKERAEGEQGEGRDSSTSGEEKGQLDWVKSVVTKVNRRWYNLYIQERRKLVPLRTSAMTSDLQLLTSAHLACSCRSSAQTCCGQPVRPLAFFAGLAIGRS